MKASFESVAGIIRVGQDHEEYGDPYQLSMVVTRVDETAHISGSVGEFNLKEFKAIARVLIDQGFRFVQWKRLRRGHRKMLTFQLDESLPRLSRLIECEDRIL